MSADQAPVDEQTAGAKRRYGLLLAALLLAGGAVLLGASMDWTAVRIDRPAPMPPLGRVASGSALMPWLSGVGILLLAAVLAVAATGPIGRRVIGVIVLAVSGWALVTVFGSLGDLRERLYESASTLGESVDPEALPQIGSGGRMLVIGGLALAVLSAAALIVLAGSLPRMGRRYEGAPAGTTAGDGGGTTTVGARRTTGDAQIDAWKALDAGEDPTA